MSSSILHNVWTKSKSKGGPRLLLVCMADASDNLGFCNPSMGELAYRTKLTRRHIVNIIQELETQNELFVWRKRGKGNRYVIRSAVTKNQFLECVSRHFWLDSNTAFFCWETNNQPTSEIISPATSEIISPATSEIISPSGEADFTPHYNKEPNKEEIQLNDTWDKSLSYLKGTTDKATYQQNFARTKLIKLNGTSATILTGNAYSASWISSRLNHLVVAALEDVTGNIYEVEVIYE